MALKELSVTVTTDGAGAATGEIAFPGAPSGKFAKVVRFKASCTGDQSSDYTLADADSVTVFAVTGVDSDPSYTRSLIAAEANVIDTGGEAAAIDADVSADVVAKFPLAVTVANGGATIAHTVSVVVEV